MQLLGIVRRLAFAIVLVAGANTASPVSARDGICERDCAACENVGFCVLPPGDDCSLWQGCSRYGETYCSQFEDCAEVCQCDPCNLE